MTTETTTVVKESRPIKFVVQVKMSGNAIPNEYGFATKEEAEKELKDFYYSNNPRLRWLDIKEQDHFTWRKD